MIWWNRLHMIKSVGLRISRNRSCKPIRTNSEKLATIYKLKQHQVWKMFWLKQQQQKKTLQKKIKTLTWLIIWFALYLITKEICIYMCLGLSSGCVPIRFLLTGLRVWLKSPISPCSLIFVRLCFFGGCLGNNQSFIILILLVVWLNSGKKA